MVSNGSPGPASRPPSRGSVSLTASPCGPSTGGTVTSLPTDAVAVSVAFTFPAASATVAVSCRLRAPAGSSTLLLTSGSDEASMPLTVTEPTPAVTAAPRVTAAPAPSRKVTDTTSPATPGADRSTRTATSPTIAPLIQPGAAAPPAERAAADAP